MYQYTVDLMRRADAFWIDGFANLKDTTLHAPMHLRCVGGPTRATTRACDGVSGATSRGTTAARMALVWPLVRPGLLDCRPVRMAGAVRYMRAQPPFV